MWVDVIWLVTKLLLLLTLAVINGRFCLETTLLIRLGPGRCVVEALKEVNTSILFLDDEFEAEPCPFFSSFFFVEDSFTVCKVAGGSKLCLLMFITL